MEIVREEVDYRDAPHINKRVHPKTPSFRSSPLPCSPPPPPANKKKSGIRAYVMVINIQLITSRPCPPPPLYAYGSHHN